MIDILHSKFDLFPFVYWFNLKIEFFNEFNYSTNPTYVSSSKMVVKNESSDSPISYITSVGLFSSDNELMAVAKLSEPLKKDPSNELTIRVRLDY